MKYYFDSKMKVSVSAESQLEAHNKIVMFQGQSGDLREVTAEEYIIWLEASLKMKQDCLTNVFTKYDTLRSAIRELVNTPL